MEGSAVVLGWSEPGAAEAAARLLRGGAVVALPTETLYGLSCLAGSEVGVRRLMRLKGIRRRRGFVALAECIEVVERYLAPEQERRAVEFLRRVWPAPLSAVLRVHGALPWGEAHAGVHTAAFRVPAHEKLRALLGLVEEPVLSTSANRTGQPPLLGAEEIVEEFGAGIGLVILDEGIARPRAVPPGRAARRRASTLADFTVWPPCSLRAGEFDLQVAVQTWEAV